MPEHRELVVKAAIRLDHLRKEREQLTADLDREIQRCELELDELLAGSGRENGDGEPTIQDKLVELIRLGPMSPKDFAKALYGEANQQTVHRVRSMIWTLKKKERIFETPEGELVVSDDD